MKILFVIQRYHPVIGGSEIFAKNFVDYLSQRHQVTVYTTFVKNIKALWNKDISKLSETTPLDYPLKRYDNLTPQEIKFDNAVEKLSLVTNHPGPFLPKLWEDLVLKKIDFDLIITTAFPYDHIIPTFVACKKWKIPIIIIPLIHQEFPHLYLTGMRLNMLSQSDAIVTLSPSEKTLLENKGIDSKKIFIIKPGINPPQENLSNNKFRNNNSIPSDAKVVLFVGSKSKMKGIYTLIESMKIIWKHEPKTILLTIGPNSKEFEKYLSQQKNDVRKKILDLGLVEEKQKQMAYEACDIVALPSESESFGLVFLEAWSYSKPVIGCKFSSTFDVIDNEENGLLVEFGNKDQLSQVIIRLLKNPELAKKFGMKGKQKLSQYSLPDSLQEFEKLCISTFNNFNKKN